MTQLKQYNEKDWIDVMDFMRFPLVILVIFIHLNPNTFLWNEMSETVTANMIVYNAVCVGVSRVLAYISVPTFYFISGYLFFRGFDKFESRVWFQKLRRRVKTLLIPYFLWNIFQIIAMVVTPLCRGDSYNEIIFYLNQHNWHLFWDCCQMGGVKIYLAFLYFLPAQS